MHPERKTTLRARLIWGFATAPIIMIALNVIGILKVNAIDHWLANINDVNSVIKRYAIIFRGSVHDRAISLRDVVLNNDPKNVQISL